MDELSERVGAVVIGGAHGSLGVVRSLGRRGIPVCVLTNDHVLPRLSRYVTTSPEWPNQEGAQIEMLAKLGRNSLAGWVLFPGGDVEAELIARHRDTLDKYFRCTTPRWDVMRWACDKRLTYCLAARTGVDLPQTAAPCTRRELETGEFRFPVVLKPATKNSNDAFTRAKAWRADDRESLLARFDEASRLLRSELVVVQELIPGDGEAQYSYAALYRDGAPAASLVARRLRQYPVEFGFTSTLVETLDEPEVDRCARRLLEPLGFSGPVEVEFKHDSRDGRYKLLDINARTWTWQPLGRSAGVDFAYLAWRQAHGLPLPPSRARPGVRWMFGLRDVAAGLLLMKRGKLRPGAYLRSVWGTSEFAVWAADDPLPGLAELPLSLSRRWRRR